MNGHQATLKVVSLLLGYPGRERRSLWQEVPEVLAALYPLAARDELAAFLLAQADIGQEEIEQHYVEVFDFRKEGALYLTYHESGDLPARGPALLALQDMLRSDGCSPQDGELPDYMPLLLEWQAGLPALHADIARRMASAFARLLPELERHPSPYVHVVRAALQALPQAGADGEEPPAGPDPADVPYPLAHP